MKLKLFLCFFILLVSPLFLSKAFAEKINSFDVTINANKEGVMEVTELINYDFESLERHGIYRYIPLYSKVGDLYRVLEIEDFKVLRDGKKENFDKSETKEEVSIKIGNKDKTITGPHVYSISYKVKNGIGSNFPSYDEIYWNATGNDWQVQIDKASISFNTDFENKRTKLICFEGVFGAKDKSCRVQENKAVSGQILYPSYGLTAVAVYPKGTFPPSNLVKELPKSAGERFFGFLLDNLLLIYIALNLLLAPFLFFWYETHKNKKRFGSPVVKFEIPSDENGKRIAPAEAGTIDSAKLERDDVTATIFDLAIRKYLKLESKKKSKVLGIIGSGEELSILKLKDEDQELNNYEKKLFNRLFIGGESVKVDDLKKDFYVTFSSMEDDVFKSLVQKGYYIKNPKIQRALLAFAGVFCLFTLNIILAAVLFFLSSHLIGRTQLGDEIDYKIDGLKLFLKSMNRNYKWQAEKFYTVEQMIPYAMSLGFIDQFMKQLKIIKPDYNPTWYSGYRGSFYTSYSGFYSSVSSNITTSAPSSSSGSSGGSSGGGGGGGGGGSW